MLNVEEWKEAQKELTKRTESGTIVWNSSLFPPSIRKDAIGAIYSATVGEHTVIVYEYGYADDLEGGVTDETDVAIEFVDDTGRLLWQWPKLPDRWQLLDTIQYRASRASSFLQAFLSRSLPETTSVAGG